MFGGKESKSKKGSDAIWGGGGGGSDFWGSSSPPTDAPPAAARSTPEAAGPPGRTISLLEAVEPIFLFICEQHRVAKEGKPLSFESVRAGTSRLIEAVESRSNRDPILQQQFGRIRDPLLWYVDYWIGSSGEFPSLRDPWNQKRLGEYPADDDEGSLSGDEAFYDKLEETLKSDAQDEAANERLAFYYIAMGLGFTGVYFKAIPEHQQKLRDYMARLYPRVRRYIDANPSAKVTPETYNFTDKRDFIAPVRDRPLILLAAFLCLMATILIGYIYLYGEQKKDLKDAIETVWNRGRAPAE